MICIFPANIDSLLKDAYIACSLHTAESKKGWDIMNMDGWDNISQL